MVLATVGLLIVIVPTTALVATSLQVVTNSKDQAIAQNLASSQIEADRSAFLANPGVQPFASSSSCAASAYGPTTTNATYDQVLTGCSVVPQSGGTPFWVFQQGGWCVNSGTGLGDGTGVTMYWVLVMVAWGGSTVPSSSTVVGPSHSVVMSSALQTSSAASPPASATNCPL